MIGEVDAVAGAGECGFVDDVPYTVTAGGFAAGEVVEFVAIYGGADQAPTVTTATANADGQASTVLTTTSTFGGVAPVTIIAAGTDSTGATRTALSSSLLFGPEQWACPEPDLASSDGNAVTVDVVANDVAGGSPFDPASLRIVEGPVHGTAAATGGQVAYTPAPGFVGSDWLRYEVCSAFDQCVSETLTVGVDPGCTITGTEGPDVLVGTEGPDVICGLGGFDIIIGAGGDDVIFGGDGGDWITGGEGNDTIYGGLSADLIAGDGGTDNVIGGQGADLIGASAADDVDADPDDVVVNPHAGIDTVAPAITIAAPMDDATYHLGEQIAADYTCEDAGSGVAVCDGDVAPGDPIDTSTVGAHGFTVTAIDNAANIATRTVEYHVVYDFDGFYTPLQNAPEVNTARAGRAVPVKFSLGGDQGLEIFAPGGPSTVQIDCASTTQTDPVADTNELSGLRYDTDADQYIYLWRTDRSWAGTCQELQLHLADGTTHVVRFEFL